MRDRKTGLVESLTLIETLIAISIVVVVGLLVVWRPLTFASVDADVAAARGVSVQTLSIVFMLLLGLAVAVSVQDDGLGIAAEDVPKLFQKFSQVGAQELRHKGTGLGLATVFGIVKQHGGLHVLVNNAGITRDTFSMRMKDDDWDAVVRGRGPA